MSIDVILYMDAGVPLGEVLAALGDPAIPFSPVYFSDTDEKAPKNQVLSNEALFASFIDKNPLGFILFTANQDIYDLQMSEGLVYKLFLTIEAPFTIEQVKTWLRAISRLNVSFGRVHEWAEFEAVNIVKTTLTNVSIESKVGLNNARQLPGLYWITLISESRLKDYALDIEQLYEHVVEHESITTIAGDVVHILNFYEDPHQWENEYPRLHTITKKIPAIFDRDEVVKALSGATTYLEVQDITHAFR